MAVAYENALKINISNGNILPVYLIFGNDAYLKKQYVDKIVDKTVSRDDVFNFSLFDSECDLSELADAIEQFPMMQDKKCVLLNDYNFEAASKSDFDWLCALAGDCPDATVFIIWCNNYEPDVKKSERLKKLIAAVEKSGGMAAQIDHRTQDDLRKMLVKGAAKRGAELGSELAAYLIELCGEDINVLVSELEKLCFYVKGGKITRSVIDKVVCSSVEASIYNLSKEIFNKNIAGAMTLVDELFFLRVEPMAIFTNIALSFVDLYRTSAAVNAGLRPEEIAKNFGYGNRSFVLKKLTPTARAISSQKLSLCFEELISAEQALKSFSANERTIIEQLIIKLVYILSKGEKIVKD